MPKYTGDYSINTILDKEVKRQRQHLSDVATTHCVVTTLTNRPSFDGCQRSR